MAESNVKPRINKTRRDRDGGYAARRAANRDARNAYCQKQSAKNSEFPTYACNGKKNRYRYTGKNGETIFPRGKK